MASILVIDDDPALLRFVALLLRTEDYDVDVTTDGNDALRRLETTRPNAILLDLSMPEMDGRTFYTAAREAGYDGPIVICSAYGARDASLELGADAAITKPFDPANLLDTVKALTA
jgi:DNA-binding response OmpR family regulator